MTNQFLIPNDFPWRTKMRARGPLRRRPSILDRISRGRRQWSLVPPELPPDFSELLKGDLTRRFDTPEKVYALLLEYSPLHGGEAARIRLQEVVAKCSDLDPLRILRFLLSLSGEHPSEIVRWVRTSVLHVDSCPAVVSTGGRERPLTPVETVFAGIGQCASAAELASALISVAGFETRMWGVPGHTFLEWRGRGSAWQLEDVDLLPPGTSLPRGMSMHSLLANYQDWAEVLDGLPTMNDIPPSNAFVPTSGGALTSWRVEPDTPTVQRDLRNLNVGSIPRVSRDPNASLILSTPINSTHGSLQAENRNQEAFVIVVCQGPLRERDITRLDPYGRQHDIFLFASVEGAYEQHWANSGERLYWLVPPGFHLLTFPSHWRHVGEISLFALSSRSIWSEPFLLNKGLKINVMTHGEPQSRELPNTHSDQGELRRLNDIFRELCTEAGTAVTEQAASYAIGTTPLDAQRELDHTGVHLTHGHVLDAGCGTGGFSLAFSSNGATVTAVDISEERVNFLSEAIKRMSLAKPITASTASIENLPFDCASFDAIYCRGVLYSTNVTRSLSEFKRILRPGGTVYLTMNADAWNQYLVLDRGRLDFDAARQGRDSNYNTVWRRHSGPALKSLQSGTSRRRLRRLYKQSRNSSEGTLGLLDRLISPMRPEDRRSVEHYILRARLACGEPSLELITGDLIRIAAGLQIGPTVTVSSQAWEPEEFGELVSTCGFEDFSWNWWDGDSKGPAQLRPLQSGFVFERPDGPHGHFRGRLATWQCSFVRR